MGRRKTHEEFLEELKEKNPNAYEELEFLEEYGGALKKTKAIDRYGEILITPNDLLRGNFPDIQSAINKTEYFKNMLKEKNQQAYEELEFLEEYKSIMKKILTKDKYGKVYSKPNDLLQGKMPTIQLATDKNKYFENKAKTKHGAKYDYSEISYIHNKAKIKIYCNNCKEYFWQKPNGHLNGQGCPNCAKSKGEEKIEKCILDNNIKYEKQKTFKGCKYKKLLRFDFYLPFYNICIEFDGIQHFEPVKSWGGKLRLKSTMKKDSIKTKYCKDNGIKLIRIPYTEFNNIEEILKKELF